MATQETNGVPSISSTIDKLSKDYARRLDETDALRHLRKEFVIPSRADLKSKTLQPTAGPSQEHVLIVSLNVD